MITRAAFSMQKLELVDKAFLVEKFNAAFLFFHDLASLSRAVSKTAHIAKWNPLSAECTARSAEVLHGQL